MGRLCSPRATSEAGAPAFIPDQITKPAPRQGASAFSPGKAAAAGSRKAGPRISSSPKAAPASRIQRRAGVGATPVASSEPVSSSQARSNGR